MDVDEVLGRRDVVVDEHHPIGQRVGHARRARSDRKMMDQDVVGMAGVGQVAVVHGQVFETRVGGLNENLRLVAGVAQHALDAQHLVTDRIAVAERRQHLMDGGAMLIGCPRAAAAAAPRAAGAAAGAPRIGGRALIAACVRRPPGGRACGLRHAAPAVRRLRAAAAAGEPPDRALARCCSPRWSCAPVARCPRSRGCR